MAKKNVNTATGLYKEHLLFRDNVRVNRHIQVHNLFSRYLTELAVNRFEWKNLPETIDERYLELVLFHTGLAVFYDDTDFGYLALRGTGSGVWNMYDNPKAFNVVGNDFINKTLSAKDCVPIYNNYLRTPDFDIVSVYAQKLAELDISIEINTRNMRIPKIFTTTDGQRLSVENFQRQIDEGAPLIVTAEGVDFGNAQAHDIGVDPRNVEALLIARSRHWADCMTMLGINNSNQDKKERLVSGEVEANNQQVLATRAVALNARQQACNQINDMFGLNVSVDFRIDVEELVMDSSEESEVEDNENDDA